MIFQASATSAVLINSFSASPSPSSPTPVGIISALPFSVVDEAIVSGEHVVYSYTPQSDEFVRIDTCGSYGSADGIDTLVQVWERVAGPNSDFEFASGLIDDGSDSDDDDSEVVIEESDFMMIAQNDDSGLLCDPDDGSLFEYDSVLGVDLFANVQYLIVVVRDLQTCIHFSKLARGCVVT